METVASGCVCFGEGNMSLATAKVSGYKRVKTRKCAIKTCRQLFQPRSMSHKCCSPECAQEYATASRAKKERKVIRELRANSKTRAKHLQEAQAAFNAWIRKRDEKEPCISCGRFHQGQWHAGHYRSVGAAPALRFVETNVHKQCAPCNNHKSGNVVEYRLGLIKRIGQRQVEWLEGPHDPVKYTIPDIIAIKAEYRKRIRELK